MAPTDLVYRLMFLSLQPELSGQSILLSHPWRTSHSAMPETQGTYPPILSEHDPLGHLSRMDVFLYSSTLIPVIRWSITFQSSIRDHSLCPPSSSTSALGSHRTTDVPVCCKNIHVPAGPWGQHSIPLVLFAVGFPEVYTFYPCLPPPTLPSVVSPTGSYSA